MNFFNDCLGLCLDLLENHLDFELFVNGVVLLEVNRALVLKSSLELVLFLYDGSDLA